MSAPNQFALFGTRRFMPLFGTQFLGAFNDNLCKNALIVLIGFHGLTLLQLEPALMIQLAHGIFILPFFLLSGLSGQLADKYDKATLARWVKLLEIAIMLLASWGFLTLHAPVLITCLFLLGVHSTVFGPIKYALLPQHLDEHEIVGGNGMVEMGTFLAILLGQIGGTLLMGADPQGHWLVTVLLLTALAGWGFSRAIPAAPPPVPQLRVDWNPVTTTLQLIKHVHGNRVVFLSIMGISWFWFLGAIYLAQLPDFAKTVLGGSEAVYTLLITLFSLGIGIGSAWCERLSGSKVEIGLVPLGSVGLTLFGIDLYLATAPMASPAAPLLSLGEFLQSPAHWRVMADITLLGLFGGFYIVPLYALVQLRTEASYRSRAIAANNVLNACFMVVAALVAAVLLAQGITIPVLLLIVALMNVPVALYIYGLVPEFAMRFLVWIFTNTLYRIRYEGLAHIPEEGPCVLVCNHVSFMDALLIIGACRRPVRFVMDHRIFRTPVLSFIFRTARAIPIAPAKEDAALKARALDDVALALQAGEVVCIFPEGSITRSGEIDTFRPGIEHIIQRTPVAVIPMALQGLWGSFFSRKHGAAMRQIPRRLWSRIALRVGAPVAPQQVSASDLHARVSALRGAWR
jgi:1-acyl-sn-glycerol-3-phosphate acyltransferase